MVELIDDPETEDLSANDLVPVIVSLLVAPEVNDVAWVIAPIVGVEEPPAAAIVE